MDPHHPDCICQGCRAQAETLALLMEHHRFPGPYMFKIIGFDDNGFLQRVRLAAEEVLGPLNEDSQVRSRPSAGHKYLAVTLDVEVDSPDQVLAVYAGLRRLEGLMVLV
ncbi:MAG: DUF493 domain-containing protein [Desulfarculus sp.]|jgi:putative lipoic acid-binding regulatory protein|nr:MAG: DUF493 domain-containing protein [Desulfarculus sp.]